MTKKKTNSVYGVSVGSDYWISYTDIMTGLLLIFIIIIMGLILSLGKAEQEAKKEKARYEEKLALLQKEKEAVQDVYEGHQKNIDALVQAIEKNLRDKGIYVTLDQDTKTIHIANDSLGFVKGKYEIDQAYVNVIYTMRDVIYSTLLEEEKHIGSLDTVFIEGHTDKDPYYNDKLKGNWGLSTLRAISFWEKLIDDGENSNLDDLMAKCASIGQGQSAQPSSRLQKSCYFINLRNSENKNMFSVSGYAASRPHECALEYMTDGKFSENCQKQIYGIKEGSSIQEKTDALNRRIDIRFVPKSPTAKEIQDMMRKKASK